LFVLKHQDDKAKAEFVRKFHEKVKTQIEKKVESYSKHANKGRRKVVFEPDDWVWVHFRKERFLSQKKSKLMPRGDGPFQMLAKINDNAYKIDLLGEYNVNNTFNVSDLSLYDADNELRGLRPKAFEEGGNDEDIQAQVQVQTPIEESLQGLGWLMTRARAKKVEESLQQVVAIIFEAAAKEKDLEAIIIQNILIIEGQ